MPLTHDTIESLIKGHLLSARSQITTSPKISQGIFALALLFFLLGTGFILYGVYAGLSARYSIEMTPIIMGFILGIIGVIAAALAYAFNFYRRLYIRRMSSNLPQKLHEAFLQLDGEWGDIIRAHPKTAVFIASLLGFIAEERL